MSLCRIQKTPFLKESIFITEYHRDPYWARYYLFYMLMISQDHLIYYSQYYLLMIQLVLIEGVSYEDIIINLNIELQKVDSWLRANKLTIKIFLNTI